MKDDLVLTANRINLGSIFLSASPIRIIFFKNKEWWNPIPIPSPFLLCGSWAGPVWHYGSAHYERPHDRPIPATLHVGPTSWPKHHHGPHGPADFLHVMIIILSSIRSQNFRKHLVHCFLFFLNFHPPNPTIMLVPEILPRLIERKSRVNWLQNALRTSKNHIFSLLKYSSLFFKSSFPL